MELNWFSNETEENKLFCKKQWDGNLNQLMTDICYALNKRETAAFFQSSVWYAYFFSYIFGNLSNLKRLYVDFENMGHLLTGTSERSIFYFDFHFPFYQ